MDISLDISTDNLRHGMSRLIINGVLRIPGGSFSEDEESLTETNDPIIKTTFCTIMTRTHESRTRLTRVLMAATGATAVDYTTCTISSSYINGDFDELWHIFDNDFRLISFLFNRESVLIASLV